MSLKVMVVLLLHFWLINSIISFYSVNTFLYDEIINGCVFNAKKFERSQHAKWICKTSKYKSEMKNQDP